MYDNFWLGFGVGEGFIIVVGILTYEFKKAFVNGFKKVKTK